MVELNQLQQLVTIYENQTISKAAEVLLISQPALTRSIQRLEDELGIKLFDRTKNKITINENGLLAVKYAKKILNQTNQMIDGLHAFDLSRQMISIGSCAPAPIWGLESLFHELYPNINVMSELDYDEQQLLEKLEDYKYTIIVVNHPIKLKNYVCQPLFDEYLYLSLPPAHPLAMCESITFDDLDGDSVLLLSKIGFWSDICKKMIPHSHLLYQNDKDVFKEITKASALPYFKSNITLLRENDNNRIAIPISDDEACVTYYAIYHNNNKDMYKDLQDQMRDFDWSKSKS
ncbi:MAG: LysR family transcriptional regulator [Erysipelotrichaceae bacterium]|nr:LysR family transcriptional regulator [Erysipelotrichaceae bacterium]